MLNATESLSNMKTVCPLELSVEVTGDHHPKATDAQI